MNKEYILLIFFYLFCFNLLAQPGKNSGVIREMALDEVKYLKFKGAMNVLIKNDTENKLTIETIEQWKDQILVTEKDGLLEITNPQSTILTEDKNIKITLYLKKPLSLEAMGNPVIFFDNKIKSENFKITTSNTAKVTIKLQTNQLDCLLNGASEIMIEGEAEHLTARLQGSSNLRAYQFKTSIGKINIDGSADADVFVTDELHANVNSAANLMYRGNPKIADITGSGEVVKK